MSAKAPPVPPANQSHKGIGDPKADAAKDDRAPAEASDADKQGQTANTAVNTTPRAGA